MITIYFISKEHLKVDAKFLEDIKNANLFVKAKDSQRHNDIIININNIEYIEINNQ